MHLRSILMYLDTITVKFTFNNDFLTMELQILKEGVQVSTAFNKKCVQKSFR